MLDLLDFLREERDLRRSQSYLQQGTGSSVNCPTPYKVKIRFVILKYITIQESDNI